MAADISTFDQRTIRPTKEEAGVKGAVVNDDVLIDDVEQSAGHFSWYSYARSSLLALNHLDEEQS